MMERFSSLVTKSRPWPVIGRTIFFTSDKNRPTRDEIYFIDFWRENLSMYRINTCSSFLFYPIAGLQLSIRKFMIIGTASFLTEYKLTKLERRVPAEQNALPQDFVRSCLR